jgi:hypothetical protein
MMFTSLTLTLFFVLFGHRTSSSMTVVLHAAPRPTEAQTALHKGSRHGWTVGIDVSHTFHFKLLSADLPSPIEFILSFPFSSVIYASLFSPPFVRTFHVFWVAISHKSIGTLHPAVLF